MTPPTRRAPSSDGGPGRATNVLIWAPAVPANPEIGSTRPAVAWPADKSNCAGTRAMAGAAAGGANRHCVSAADAAFSMRSRSRTIAGPFGNMRPGEGVGGSHAPGGDSAQQWLDRRQIGGRERQPVRIVAHRERNRARRRDLALRVDDQVEQIVAPVNSWDKPPGTSSATRCATTSCPGAAAASPGAVDTCAAASGHAATAAAPLPSSTPRTSTPPTARRARDMTISSVSAIRRRARWRRRRNPARSGGADGASAAENDAVHVGAAGAGGRDRQTIDDLLAGQLQLADEPPDGRVQPEQREHRLFRQHRRPVATVHVEEFVAEDGASLSADADASAAGSSTIGGATPKVTGCATRSTKHTRAGVPSSAWSAATSSGSIASGFGGTSRRSRNSPPSSHKPRSSTPPPSAHSTPRATTPAARRRRP